ADAALLYGGYGFVFTIEYPCCTFKEFAFFTGYFRNGTLGGDVSIKDLQMSGRLQWFIQRCQDFQFVVPGLNVFEVFAKRFAGNGEAIPIEQAFIQQDFQNGWCTAAIVYIFHHVFAAWFQIGDQWRMVADVLEIVQSKRKAKSLGNGQVM